ncbi:MAG: choice-of-anchor tandem repeat GloVer-containing protein [Candidatus Cybelea sp.]
MRCLLGICLLALVSIGCGAVQPPLGAPAGSAPAPLIRRNLTYEVLYRFEGRGSRNGAHPSTALIRVGGTFYGANAGTTRGAGRYGTIFTITTSGTEKLFYHFRGGPKQGAHPTDLTDVNGTLFGTTSEGGSNGLGTVFSVSRSGNETTLHSFAVGAGDGAKPNGLVNVEGTLYGTTSAGGTNGEGTVFSITPSGTETVVYNFGGSQTDGEKPTAPLINVGGTLYGTTAAGGTGGNGTVFAMTPSGKETVLYNFKGGAKDGANPEAPLFDVGGVLYGTTWDGGSSQNCGNGCGTVFAITPSGKETVVYSFKAGTPDGAYPDAPVVDIRGTLYGTTFFGGTKSAGTIFAIARSGKETMLHSFGGSTGGVLDGRLPGTALLNESGTLYGTTTQGGGTGAGTVFALTP